MDTSYRIIQDAPGSPGCTRAVMTAKVLVSVGVESTASERTSTGEAGGDRPVMVTRSQGKRHDDRHRLVT